MPRKTERTKLGKRISVKDSIGSTMKHITDTKTEGVGKYAKGTYSRTLTGKTVKGLTRGQTYKLEKRALKNEALKINAKPEMIRAIGSAFAQNLAAPGAGIGLGVGSNLTTNNSKVEPKIGSLISGGAQQAGTTNEEEEQSLQDQYQIR